MLMARPECMVHGSRPVDYRAVRNIICTCHPIRVAKEPPTQPAMPPTRKQGEHRA